MFTPSTLLIAVVLSCTALWSGFVSGTMSVTDALIRFLIAVPVAALMSFALRSITRNYGKKPERATRPDTAAADNGAGLEAGRAVR